MNADEPRWTALALGEPATPDDLAALAHDAAAREELARTRAMARLLTAMYREERRPRRRARPWLLAAAALVALVALWAWRLDRDSATMMQHEARRATPAVRVHPARATEATPAGGDQGAHIIVGHECE